MTTLREAFTGFGLQVDDDYDLIVEAVRTQYLSGPTSPSQVAAQVRCADRRAKTAERIALYRDDAADQIEKLLLTVYESDEVRKLRARLTKLIGFANVPKRITDEVASLYTVPAKRRFVDDARAEAFAAIESEVDLHSVMKEASRLTFLCNNVLLWSMVVGGKRSLRIVTPDKFDAIPNPRDALDLVAVLIDAAPAWVPPAMTNRALLPHYELWDAEVKITLNAMGQRVGPVVRHGLGRIPGVLMSSRLPVDRLLDERPGEDIMAAARAALLLNLCLISLSHTSSERQPYLQGPTAQMATEQPQHAGVPLVLPPGVTVGTLDLVTDPEHLLKVARHVVASVAQSYGMSYEQFVFSETADTASGKAYTVRRQKLTELRIEQRGRALVHERAVMELLGFGDALAPDFAEQEAPTDPLEELDVFDRRCNRGLDNPIAYLQRKDPDLTVAQATARFLDNVSVTGWLFSLLRALNMSLSATADQPGQTPAQNGAAGAANPSPGAIGAVTRSATEGSTVPATGMATAA